jgi:glycine cleavage system H protein
MAARYTKDHEWIRVEGDVAACGISNHAAEQLGDVVYVELPEIGRKVKAGEAIAVVESAKAASDVYAPASGEIVAVNDALGSAPEKVNEGAESGGWFVKLKLANAGELDALMDEAAYAEFAKG